MLKKCFTQKQKQRWTSEQIKVLPQTEGESCGCRMLYNINRVCEQQEIKAIDREVRNSIGRICDRNNENDAEHTSR